tara:strand:- start:1606 stop:1917 length:312 start_codon:yes stop_codon:yes gene_type:complete
MTKENVTNLNLKTLDDLALSKARSIDDMVTKILQTDWSFVQRLVRNAIADVETDAGHGVELEDLSRSALWHMLEDLLDAQRALEKIVKFQHKFDVTPTETGDE